MNDAAPTAKQGFMSINRLLRERAGSGGPSRVSLQSLAWGGTILAFAGLVLLHFWITWQSGEREIAAARVRTQNLARLFDEHMVRTIDSVDMLLRAAANQLGPDPSSAARRSSATAMLSELARSQPYVLAVRMLDRQTGSPVFAFAQDREIGHRAETDADMIHGRGPHHGLYIGRPVQDEVSGASIIGVSRRGGGRDGGPGNVVVAHVALDYLQRFIDEVDVGAKGSVSLFRVDGMLLARHPHDPANVGRDFSNAPLFREQLARGPVGTYEGRSPTDGVERILTYRRLDTLPLVFVVGLGRSEVLAEWRQGAIRDLAIATAAIGALFAFGYVLGRMVVRRAEAEATLRALG